MSTQDHQPINDLERIFVSEEQIANRIAELGSEIDVLYANQQLVVIAIINGALIFTADLIRHIRLPLKLDCLRASSYGDGMVPQSAPRLLDPIRLDVRDRHVLLIDDILDTGNTLTRVRNEIAKLGPSSLRTCVLLDKKARRQVPFEADLVGFQIPDEFVVGYGLDFAEKYRHLPCIGVLKKEHQTA